MAGWENYLDQNQDRFLDELLEFLCLPSISSLPEHAGDVEGAAEWCASRLQAAGLESVRVMPTGGHPAVYGEWLHAPGKPTVLIYGHFDTQPVDPLELWETPPFEPVVRNGRIYARGATDDKGNLFIPLIVAEAMLKSRGALPLNLKFLLEGQEEIGSPQMPEFMAAHKDLLACDLILSADGGQWDEEQPILTMGTRGLAAVFLEVRGPGHDLHSGIYGGTIHNPIHVLSAIIASMHDPEGRIAVEGFYDQVRDLTREEKERLASVPFDQEAYLKEIGARGLFGEPGFSTYERAWTRPTLEINGIWGGFQGEGLKTVLPSLAQAKISCRLVADQDPARITDLLLAHVEKVAPQGVEVKAVKAQTGASPYLIPSGDPGLEIAASVLKEIYGREPFRIGTGGTVPVNALFLESLGAYTVTFGFGQDDERQHSPNEFFRLSNFKRGQRAYGLLLDRLAEKYPARPAW